MHAVWLMAHVGGRSCLDDLKALIRDDPEPRVQVQAVRAVADLADPDFVQHRLSAGPGDSKLAGRLAALTEGRDPRVVLELVLAIGRLRWPDAPAWLRRTLSNPDPALAHAAIQTLRRSSNWPAVLTLLDEPDGAPVRHSALIALADRSEPAVVDGLVVRLETEQNPDRISQYADILARVYKKPKPWSYWGYRPAPRPANTIAWERTATIGETLDRILAHPDLGVRLAVLKRVQREEIPTRLGTLHDWLRTETNPDAVTSILTSLRSHPADARINVLAEVIADPERATSNRLEALALWPGRNEEGGANSTRLSTLAASLDDGPILAAALNRLDERALPDATPLLLSKLASPDAHVRTAAIEISTKLRVPGAAERLHEVLADPDPDVRRAAAAAAGALDVKSSVDRLLALARDKDLTVRSASLDSLRRLEERRVVPLAVEALADRTTQLSALSCIAELGGPSQSAALIDLAKRSPSAELLSPALQALTRWSHDQAHTQAQPANLDRAVAEVQGVTGLLVRWEFSPPMSAMAAASIVARNGTPDRLFVMPTTEIRGAWATVFASGADTRVQFTSDAETKPDSVRLAYTDLFLSDPATVQFLASCSGTFHVWSNGTPLYHRSTIHAFRADSDCFEADLAEGRHRILIEVGSASNQPAEFHLRFRRKSSSAERERLAQTALTTSGDPDRGRKLFEDIDKSQCLKCHRLGDQGERIGPELTGIGGRYARITIIESILEPSRAIAPSYDSLIVAINDGRILTGVKADETPSTLTIADREGKKHEIPKSLIDAMHRQPQSTMPDGLEQRLTADEFVDLVSFLYSQK
jgi:putative heme-binding domain-containing protein